MLKSMRSRMMSEEVFLEISRMIVILFENGIMLYTGTHDPADGQNRSEKCCYVSVP